MTIYNFSNLTHPIGQDLTLPLTIQKVEWEDRAWGKVLKITFAENINYGNIDLQILVNLKQVDCNHNNLTDLGLAGCESLEVLDCSNNQLINLNLANCLQLIELKCENNLLVDWSFLTGWEGSNLKELNLSDNNFPEGDLVPLKKLVKMKKLYLGSYDEERIQKGIYNRFTGSLKPLEDMNKLEELNIGNTDIDSGLEYLPDSLEWFSSYSNYIEEEEREPRWQAT